MIFSPVFSRVEEKTPMLGSFNHPQLFNFMLAPLMQSSLVEGNATRLFRIDRIFKGDNKCEFYVSH